MVETTPPQLRVLHVDDNERFLDLFAYTYKKAFDVISASNVATALEILRTHPIDVIITDYEMVDMNGLELLRLVKEEFPDIPVIFYTGQGNEEVARNAFLSGAFDYHIKELGGFAHREKIINSVRRAMEKKSADISLRESQVVYRNVIENIPMAMVFYTLSADGNLVISGANQAGDRLMGPDCKDYLGKPIGTAFPIMGREEKLQEFKNIALRGSSLHFQENLYRGTTYRGIFEIYVFQTSLRNIAALFMDITELKRIEEQLRQSEEEMRFTMAHTPIGIAMVNMDGTFRSLNKTYCDILGYTCEELMLKTFIDLTHPEDREISRSIFQKLTDGEESIAVFEKRYQRQDGSVIEALVHSGPVLDARGKPLFLVTVLEDITQRKQNELALQRERDTAQQYLDIAGVMILALDNQGNITLINKRGAEILGYEDEKQLIGINWLDTFLPPDEKERIATVFFDIVKGTCIDYETGTTTIITRSGKKRIILFHNSLIRDHSGTIIGSLSSGEDITERIKTEEELTRKEKLYRTLIQTSPDAIIVHDMQGKVVMVNQQALALAGIPSMEETTGQDVFNFIIPEDRPRAMKAVQELLSTRQNTCYEYTGLRMDNTTFPVEVIGSIIPDEEGNPYLFLIIARDITERKQTEESLQRSEELYRSLIDASPEPIVISDMQGYIWKANQATATLLEFADPEEFTGTSVFDVLVPEERKQAKDSFDKLINGGGISRSEYHIVKHDGTNISIEVSGTLIRTRKAPTLVIITARDITQRKNQETAIRESEERYKLALANTNEAIWDWNLKTGEVYFNEVLARLMGFDPGDQLHMPIEKLMTVIHPEDRPRVQDALQQHLQGETSFFESEERHKTAEDKWICVILHGKTIQWDEQGKPERMIGTVRDITRYKEEEERLKQYTRSLEETIRNNGSELSVHLNNLEQNIEKLKKDPSRVFAYLTRMEAELAEIRKTAGNMQKAVEEK